MMTPTVAQIGAEFFFQTYGGMPCLLGSLPSTHWTFGCTMASLIASSVTSGTHHLIAIP